MRALPVAARKWTAVAVAAGVLGAPASAWPAEALAGRSLADAIGVLEDSGLRVFYSTEFVRPGMQVDSEPVSDNAAAALAEILEPHGLALRPGLKGAWLVVRVADSEPAPRAASADREPSANRPPARAPAVPEPLEELIVSASRYEIAGAQTSSRRTLSALQIEHLPDLGDDAIRAVARLPGLATDGFSSLGNIRGGEISETLMRLDGVRLYEPFHLRDFQSVFSTIDPGIVSSMDVYTGGFPATFGDRMSGVIDIETLSPDDEPHHEIGVSFFNTSLLSAGEFGDDRGQWLASARRSNLDILYDRFSEQPERPRYTDIFAKLSYTISDRLTISGNILRAEDDISLSDDVDREERAASHQHDTYAWVSLDQDLGGLIAGRTLIAHTDISSSRGGTSEKQGISTGSLTDLRSFSIDTLQSEWSRLIGTRVLLGFGGSISRMQGSYDYRDEAAFELLFDIDGAATDPLRSRNLHVEPHGRRYELFSTVRVDWNARLATELGLRFSEQRLSGREHATLAPRVSLRYALSERSTIRASWGRYHQQQSITELQVSDGIEAVFAPQRSDHLVVGFDRRLGEGIRLRFELYEKSMQDLRPRFENLLNTRVLLPELKPDRFMIAPSSARARGAELGLDRRRAGFEWWGALSWAHAEDVVAGVEIPRSWDQTWALSAGFSWESTRWETSVGWIYRTGWPTSRVELDPDADFPTATIVARNDERVGPFGSLDLRVGRKIPLARSQLTISLELANLTDRANPCCIEYEIDDEEDTGELVLDRINYLPTIPSLGILWRF